MAPLSLAHATYLGRRQNSPIRATESFREITVFCDLCGNSQNSVTFVPGSDVRYTCIYVYYPMEGSSIKYCHLGVFRKECFRLFINKPRKEKCHKFLVLSGSKKKKPIRVSTQATLCPLAMILTTALWALVSIVALGLW